MTLSATDQLRAIRAVLQGRVRFVRKILRLDWIAGWLNGVFAQHYVLRLHPTTQRNAGRLHLALARSFRAGRRRSGRRRGRVGR